MMQKLADWLVDSLGKLGKRSWLMSLALFLVIMTPLALADYFDHREEQAQLTELALSRREALGHLAAILLKEKFDKVIDLGTSFATRVQFRKLIEEGKWNEAIVILQRAPKDFPYIDTVALFDPEGTVLAITPPIPEVLGTNFSSRDYYKGVSKEWKPYVSDVFTRAAVPKYNVIAVAIPIRSGDLREADQKILGFMVLSIRLGTLVDWADEVDVGSDGFAYFVDKTGHVAGHPKFPDGGEIVDFSSVPAVQRILAGEKGVAVLYNPIEKEERVSAYEPVPEYGWGVVVQEPTYSAFAHRSAALRQHLVVNSITFLLVAISVGFILFFIQTLNRYRQREKIFLDSVGDGLVAIDRYWNITAWNDTTTKLTGYSREEAMGKPFRDVVRFVRESDRKENITFIEEAMLFGKVGHMENHTLLIQKAGTEIYVGDSASPVFDRTGHVDGAIIVFRDVSPEYELEKTRQEFSSLATHQLRAPITVIKGYLELLFGNQATLSSEQKEALLAIQKSTAILGDLANAMLNVSRIDSGGIAIDPEPVYLPDIADEVIKEFSSQVDEKKIQMEKQYGKDIPSINADPKLTAAIARNLISNSVKYTAPGGKITVGIQRGKTDILVTVSDTGVGIPKDQQSKLFTKFFRAYNVQNEKTEGTGLGLYIVKSIVEQAGGKISFQSEENTGTTFYVSMPLSGMIRKEGARGLS